MKEQIQKISGERMAICDQCPHHSKNHKTIRLDAHCMSCGCTLSAKTACLSCSCPIGTWKELMTNDEYDAIRNDLNLNNGNEGEHQN